MFLRGNEIIIDRKEILFRTIHKMGWATNSNNVYYGPLQKHFQTILLSGNSIINHKKQQIYKLKKKKKHTVSATHGTSHASQPQQQSFIRSMTVRLSDLHGLQKDCVCPFRQRQKTALAPPPPPSPLLPA